MTHPDSKSLGTGVLTSRRRVVLVVDHGINHQLVCEFRTLLVAVVKRQACGQATARAASADGNTRRVYPQIVGIVDHPIECCKTIGDAFFVGRFGREAIINRDNSAADVLGKLNATGVITRFTDDITATVHPEQSPARPGGGWLENHDGNFTVRSGDRPFFDGHICRREIGAHLAVDRYCHLARFGRIFSYGDISLGWVEVDSVGDFGVYSVNVGHDMAPEIKLSQNSIICLSTPACEIRRPAQHHFLLACPRNSLPPAETSRHDRARDLPLENDIDEQYRRRGQNRASHDDALFTPVLADEYNQSDG